MELAWRGWKDIDIDIELRGDTITKGRGFYEKEYIYINIPSGYGYDNYCMLLSAKLVCRDESDCYFSIRHDMNIELFYSPVSREKGKKYKRYKMSGYELYEQIFKAYEENNRCEKIEQQIKQQKLQDNKNKKISGKIVCGLYRGNRFATITDLKYAGDNEYKAFFYNGKAYSNAEYSKIQNVNIAFVIAEKINKYEFQKYEIKLNEYLREYTFWKDMKRHLENYAGQPKNGIELDGKAERIEKQIAMCVQNIHCIEEEIKKLVR